MVVVFLPFFLLVSAFGYVAADGVCDAVLDAGSSPCSKKASVKFHLDPVTRRCLAFKYTGCGGNANNFDSISQCRQRCIPMDRLKCPANTSPLKNDKGTTNCGREAMEPKCADQGAYCQMGAHGDGLCCSQAAKDKTHEDHKKQCANGSEKYRMESGGHQHVLLGKDCSTDFCPSGYQCQKGNFYAFCCKK